MKNRSIILVMVCLLCIMLMCVACGQEESGEVTNVKMSASMIATDTYSYQADSRVTASKPYILMDSYRDDDYYYYCLKLGTIKNVIVDDNPYTIRYTGQSNIKRSYTTSVVTSTSIERQSSWLSERLVYDNNLAGWSASFGVEVGIFEKISVKVSASASAQYYQNTTTTSNSTSEKTKQEETVTESQTLEITFDDSCPAGEYRISHVMDYDVFLVVVKEIKTNRFSSEYMTLPKKGVIELYEYSANGFSDVTIDKVDFDYSCLNKLPVPQTYENSGKDRIEEVKSDIDQQEETKKDYIYRETIRTGTTTIYNRNNYVTDNVRFSFTDISYDELKKNGYKNINISLSIDIKEYRTSSDLYNGVRIEDKSGTLIKKWEYMRHHGDWDTYTIEANGLNIDDFYIGNNTFKVKVIYYCLEHNYQDWYLGTVKMTVTAY